MVTIEGGDHLFNESARDDLLKITVEWLIRHTSSEDLIGPKSAKSEIMSAFIGLFLHAIGGLAAASFTRLLSGFNTGSGNALPCYGVLRMDCGPIERRPINRTGFHKGTIKLPAQ